jgi:large subunit ribosomal protein L1
VIAFCDDSLVEAAKKAGAIEAGSDELIKKITDGWMDFDVAIASPKVMGKVGKLGSLLDAGDGGHGSNHEQRTRSSRQKNER